jgi:hypothetical protein
MTTRVLLCYATHMTPRRGPGPVAAAHRILIAAALLCGLAYAAWELAGYGQSGEPGAAVRGVVAIVVSGLIGVYLRSLRGLGAKLTPRDDPGISRREP